MADSLDLASLSFILAVLIGFSSASIASILSGHVEARAMALAGLSSGAGPHGSGRHKNASRNPGGEDPLDDVCLGGGEGQADATAVFAFETRFLLTLLLF
mmetsp:Transcript_104800/g.181069  ORF Transcript_104800/g.181069 Transcript_104800/m.181069 type:complete len:100 (+) Transcript_104800:926-1225(+)